MNQQHRAQYVSEIIQTLRAAPQTVLKKRKDFFGTSLATIALLVAMVFLVLGKFNSAHAGIENPLTINGPQIETKQLIQYKDGLPVTIDPHQPALATGVSVRPEVVLDAGQLDIVKRLNEFLISKGEAVIITSGTRTGESQLDIIKQRIDEAGVTTKFPLLAAATLKDSKIWFDAWNWLRRRHVPINPPADLASKGLRSSLHIKGRAVDMISKDLGRLHALVAEFIRSDANRKAAQPIYGLVREPYCVHISLSA